jgi:organic hydroperoxide reductase OsmC/OhrA
MSTQHHYTLTTIWKGNKGSGTSHISKYDRSHTLTIGGKPDLYLTTDNTHVGDKSKHNPEDLLVAALSSCHMLSFLYVCALEGVIVVDYIDNATGIMEENSEGGGHFTEVTLNPVFTVSDRSMVEKAIQLHKKAHDICFIANSVNFKVMHKPVCKTTG